jgi:protein-disulfide isomerase/uncharacterized membrane protein
MLLAGLVGLALSAYLGLQHSEAAGASACNISSTINCDAVNRSEYSELFGYPIAFLGSGFYAAVALAGFLGLRQREQHRLAGHLIALGGGLSVLYSLFLAYVSSQKIGAWCPFCIGMYGINAIILAGGILWARKEEGTLGEALIGKEDRSLSSMGSIFVGVVLLGSLFRGGAAVETDGAASLSGSWPLAATTGPLLLDGTEPVYGNDAAPLAIVEFADFQCPFCADVAPRLKRVVDSHPELKMMFKHYPISSKCNESVVGERHENSCDAAAATECAGQQGKFWEMNKMAFKNQNFLSTNDLFFLAQQIGLDEGRYKECMADPATMEAVKADVAHAVSVGITGTPSLFFSYDQGKSWSRIDGVVEELETVLARIADGQTPQIDP